MEQNQLTLYWVLATYLIGYMVAVILIECINEIQMHDNHPRLIPPVKALLSWVWVAICLIIFINTYFTRK